MAAILKSENGGHIGIGANVNIDFQFPDDVSFSKIYSFQILNEKSFMNMVTLTN